MNETAKPDENERLVTGYTGRLLIGLSVSWAFIQTGRLVLPPLLPSISADLGLSSTRAGFAITVIWGLYALMQYPSGRLSDQLSRKTLIGGAFVSLCIGFLVLSIAPTYLVFLAGAVAVGVGTGLYATPALGLISDYFVDRRGQAFGVHSAFGDFGGVVAAGLATVVIGIAAWRAAFFPVIVALIALGLSLHVWGREDYVFERVELVVGETLRRLFEDPDLRWLLFSYTLFAFSWQSVMAFLPTYLQVDKGFSPALANTLFAAIFVVGAIVKPIAGGLGDRLSRELLSGIVLAVAAAMLGAVILASVPVVAVAAVICFAAGLMAYPPVMQAVLMDSFPNDSMGGDFGAVRSIYIGIGAIGPTYVGVVADELDYTTAFVGIVACLLLGSLLIFARGRT